MSIRAVTLALAGAASLAALPARAEPPQVAADIAPVHSLVAQVMAGVGTPELIVRPGASPHGYALRPSEAGALQDADLVVWIGPELTPWLDRSLDTLAPEAARLTLLAQDETRTRPFRTGATFAAHDHGAAEDAHGHEHEDEDHGHDDAHAHADEHGHEEHEHEHESGEHAHGDHEDAEHAHDDHAQDEAHAHDHTGTDPHAWLDPANGKAWLDVIAAELSRADPGNAGTYLSNAADAKAEIDATVADIEARLDGMGDLSFVVFHDAYQYFEARFGLSAAGAISLSDATDPSPARIAELREMVAARGIDCAFAEPQFAPGILEAVFSETDAEVAVIDPMGTEIAPGPDFYPALLRSVADSFARCG